MQHSVKIDNVVEDDDDDNFFSAEEYRQCVTTPWRRLCYALGQCWQEHNSCLGSLDLHHSYYIPRRNNTNNDYEDSTRTALLSDEDLHHNMMYQPNDIRWDRPFEPMFQDKSKKVSLQTAMDKGGIVYMAPLSSLQKRPNKPALTRKIRTHWKIQRRMLPFSTANSSQRPIPLHDDDDYDNDGLSSVFEKSLSLGGKRSKRNVQQHSQHHQHRHHHLLVENYWPHRETIKPLVQPRSASAFDNVLTVGSSTAVECLMIPPEPSLRSNPGDSCSSSLSSKEEFTRFDASYPAPKVTNTEEITHIQTRIPSLAYPEDEDDGSSGRNATSKLYPQSLTRSMTAPAGQKSIIAQSLPRSRTAPAGQKPLPVENNSNNKGKLQFMHAQDDHDEDGSTGGSCRSIPRLTVSYEDDAAQLAVAFSSSLRDDTDSEFEEEEEEFDEEGRPLVPQTMGLHCFTLGANFSHPAAEWTQPVRRSSLAPPPPSSPTSSVGSSSSSKSMSDASQKRGRKIGISFPHPWYSSKLLHVPKREIPEQRPQQRQLYQQQLAKDRGELYHYQQQRQQRYQQHQQQHQQQSQRHQHRQQNYHNTKENSFVEERDDVWSMVESDPMDGDMTDPPTPVPIQTSKVWSPDNMGWSSSDDDVGETPQFDTSTPSSWRWPKHHALHTYRDKTSHSSRSWEELPEDGDGFIVRKPAPGSNRRLVVVVDGSLERRLEQAQALLTKRDGRATREAERTKTAMYSPRLAYPPLQPLFMNT